MTPTRTARAARKAARRALLARFAGRLGPCLSVAGGAAIGVIALDRMLGWGVPWYAIVVGAGVGGLVVAGALAARGRWTDVRAAIELDAVLGLKDGLSSALSLRDRKDADPAFVDLAIRDAERKADQVRVNRAIPVRLGWTWVVWPVVGAAAVGAGLLIPYRAMEGPTAPSAAEVARAEDAAEQIRRTSEALRDAMGDPEVVDAATRRELDEIDRLEQELRSGARDSDEARSEAARRVNELSRRLRQESEQQRLEQEALRDRLADMQTEPDGRTAELVEKLRSGDLEAAREAARQLFDNVDRLSPEERDELVRELESLAEQTHSRLDEPAPDEPDDAFDEREIARQLEEEGFDPEAAERRAREIAEENRRHEAERSAEEQARDLADAFQEAADELRDREDERPDPGAEDDPGERDDEAAPDGEESDERREGEREDAEGVDSERAPRGREGEEGERRREEGAREDDGERTGERREEEGAEAGERTEGEAGEDAESRERAADDRREEGEAAEGATEEGATEDDGERTEGPDGVEGEEAGPDPDAEGDEEGRTEEGAAPEEGAAERRGVDRLRERLDHLAERQRQSQDSSRRAEDLDERARDLLGPDPSGRDAGRDPRAREDLAPRDPMDVETEDVDARGEPGDGPPRDDERVAAEWDSDEMPDADSPIGRLRSPEGVREAARSAERAIEQQEIPRRYRDLVRGVFRRLESRAGEEGQDPPIAPPGRDADSGGSGSE